MKKARKAEGPKLSRAEARVRARDRARTHLHKLELRAERKLARETHDARMRAKYGPSGKPAAVTVKTLKEI